MITSAHPVGALGARATDHPNYIHRQDTSDNQTSVVMSKVQITEKTLLYKYLGQLATNPLRTKAITNATLNGTQEILASFLAGEKTKEGSYISERVPKMMIYGLS